MSTDKATPNLFSSLYKTLQPEDFLTESFAYMLNTDERVRNVWLSRLLPKGVVHALDLSPSKRATANGGPGSAPEISQICAWTG